MRLEGPMQSWGVQSRFEVRDTGSEPSKSGVIGLVCAALGRVRSESIADLSQLRMGVRVDREGQMRRDYQTATRWKHDRRGSLVESYSILSERHYLADASFLVGLEGDDVALLRQIDSALESPRWPLCLGRRAFAPCAPVRVCGPIEEILEHALTTAATRARHNDDERPLRLVIESRAGDDAGLITHRRPDQPVSFLPRRFTSRDVTISFAPIPRAAEDPRHVPL
jgi:CRISPR system Cascade subunit CasD